MKKQYRIKKNEEFSRIIEEKRKIASSNFIIYYSPKAMDYSRVGLSVSKKLGIAPIRNKVKRQIRMMFIENYNFEEEKNDLVIIVRNNYLNNSYEDNRNDLEKLIKKAII